MSRRRRYGALGLLVLVAAVAGVWCLRPVGREFDGAAWQDQSKVQSGARQGMADRLVARRVLIGMTRDQVIAMLGPPEQRSSDASIFYGLGPERGFISVDGELLMIELDENGKVSACRIITT